jgi:hypothetical protein
MRSEINSSIRIAVAQRLELIDDLEVWRLKCSHTFTMRMNFEVDGWNASETTPFGTLLTLQYYSTAMLINNHVLTSCVSDTDHWSGSLRSCTDEAAIAIKHDFVVARALCNLVGSIAKGCPGFIDQNAIWWMCNYCSKIQYSCLCLGLSNERQLSQPLYISLAYSWFAAGQMQWRSGRPLI